MAVEFIEILKGKDLLKSSTSAAKEITEVSVKDSVISYTLNVLRGIAIGEGKKAKKVELSQVLRQSSKDTKVWVLTLKYGVVPVSMAKITATTKEEAVADAIKYVEGLKTKMSDNIVKQLREAVESKKKSLAKAEKTRNEAKAKKKA